MLQGVFAHIVSHLLCFFCHQCSSASVHVAMVDKVYLQWLGMVAVRNRAGNAGCVQAYVHNLEKCRLYMEMLMTAC